MLESKSSKNHYALTPINGTKDDILVNTPLVDGRYLVGRAGNCNIIVARKSISAVHAIIEIKDKQIRVYDLNSTNGTFVNEIRIVTENIRVNDVVRFADLSFRFSPYVQKPQDVILDSIPELPSFGELPQTSISVKTKKGIVHPLAKDQKSEGSEYIFEDSESIYPIFHYEVNRQAIEVLTSFNNRVFAISYVPEKDGTYNLVGINPGMWDIEFPYIGKSEVLKFIDINGPKYQLYVPDGFKTYSMKEGEALADKKIIEIADDDLIQLTSGSIQIYVRRVPAPPTVDAPPFFKRDKAMRFAMLFSFSAVSLLSVFMLANKDEIKKEDEAEKAPERIAKILYQPVVKPVEKEVPKPEPKIQEQPKKKIEVAKKQPEVESHKDPIKTAPVQEVRKVEKVGSPAQAAPKTNTPPAQAPTTNVAANQNIPEAKGPVDVYKSTEFKSSLSSLLAKGNTGLKKSTSSSSSSSADIGTGAAMAGSSDVAVKTAEVKGDVGSLTGLASGKVDFSKGSEGLSTKKTFYTGGLSTETVVLGSMDPNEILRILREHLPQFRFCYQSELERTAVDVQGVVKMKFTIGSTGNVTQAGVESGSGVSSGVKSCVINVLKGIQFPRPLGGGTVDVTQPMNFQPKRI